MANFTLHGMRLTNTFEFNKESSYSSFAKATIEEFGTTIPPTYTLFFTQKGWDYLAKSLSPSYLFFYDEEHEHIAEINHYQQLANGQIATLSRDGMIKIWYLTAAKCKFTVPGVNTAFVEIADNQILCASYSNKTLNNKLTNVSILTLYNLDTGTYKVLPFTLKEIINNFITLKNSSLIAIETDEAIKVLNLHSGECEQEYYKNNKEICDITYLGFGLISLMMYCRKKVQVWDLNTGTLAFIIDGHSSEITHLKLASEHLLFTSSAENQLIEIWNLNSKKCEISKFFPNINFLEIIDVRHLINEQFIFLVDNIFNPLRNWNSKTGKQELNLQISYFIFDKLNLKLMDGRIACRVENMIKLYNIESQKVELILRGHRSQINSLIELTDGRLVSAGEDKSIKVWNLQTGKCEIKLFEKDAILFIHELPNNFLCIVFKKAIKIIELNSYSYNSPLKRS